MNKQLDVKDFSMCGNEAEIQKIISHLKFIAKLEVDEKISVSSLRVYAKGWVTSVLRSVYREDRWIALRFVNETINKGMELLMFYSSKKEDFYQRIAQVLHDALVDSCQGLKILCETYKTDRKFVSELEALDALLGVKLDQCQINPNAYN